MKTHRLLKFVLPVVLILCSFGVTFAQTSSDEIVRKIKEEIALNKGRTLQKAPNKIFHVYSVEVPVDAVIEDNETQLLVYPVYVTLVYRSSSFKVEKIRIPFYATIYKTVIDFIASLNSSHKKLRGFNSEVIWKVEDDSKSFKSILDNMPNLKTSTLESLWGESDNFPSSWKK